MKEPKPGKIKTPEVALEKSPTERILGLMKDQITLPRIKILKRDKNSISVKFRDHEYSIMLGDESYGTPGGGGGSASAGLGMTMADGPRIMIDQNTPEEFKEMAMVHEICESEYLDHQMAVAVEMSYAMKHLDREQLEAYLQYVEIARQEALAVEAKLNKISELLETTNAPKKMQQRFVEAVKSVTEEFDNAFELDLKFNPRLNYGANNFWQENFEIGEARSAHNLNHIKDREPNEILLVHREFPAVAVRIQIAGEDTLTYGLLVSATKFPQHDEFYWLAKQFEKPYHLGYDELYEGTNIHDVKEVYNEIKSGIPAAVNIAERLEKAGIRFNENTWTWTFDLPESLEYYKSTFANVDFIMPDRVVIYTDDDNINEKFGVPFRENVTGGTAVKQEIVFDEDNCAEVAAEIIKKMREIRNFINDGYGEQLLYAEEMVELEQADNQLEESREKAEERRKKSL